MISQKTIQESVDVTISQHLNAPEFAYFCLTGKILRLRGRRNHPEKIIDGIVIDKDIPTEAIQELNRMKEIEVRASCQGDEECPTFLIFRLVGKFDYYDYNKKIVNCINQKLKIGKCCMGYGRQGFVRICVTADRNELKSKFNLWWKELPKIISSCVKEI
jgi:hypothetical protein